MSRLLLRKLWICSVSLILLYSTSAAAQEAVFSGPQVGEKLPPLIIQPALGDTAGEKVDVIGQAGDKPLLLIFVHARTRPAFGLMRVIGSYATTRSDRGLQTCVVFLTQDGTETEKWLKVVENQLPKGITYGVSVDGLEGPGAYGLNRNVILTILVGNQGKVTGNFALLQPQLQADGPGILKAIANATGGGDVPTIEQLGGDRYGERNDMQAAGVRGEMNTAELSNMLRSLIQKQATTADIEQAAERIEKYISENEQARAELARIVQTIVSSGKLENYGNEVAQNVILRWHTKLGQAKAANPSHQTPVTQPHKLR